MLRFRQIDIDRRDEIYKEIEKFAARLRKKFRIKAIYLFGSFATGEIHEGSDIDLIVVGDFKGRIFDRIDQVTRLTDLPIEPLVYTEEQFQSKIREGSSFFKEVLATAKKL
jgi:hypothetical protein